MCTGALGNGRGEQLTHEEGVLVGSPHSVQCRQSWWVSVPLTVLAPITQRMTVLSKRRPKDTFRARLKEAVWHGRKSLSYYKRL